MPTNRAEILQGVEGGIALVSGRAEIEILNGPVQIIGYPQPTGHRFEIPLGKTIPLVIRPGCSVRILLSDEGSIETLRESTIPPDWDRLVDTILKRNTRLILILGSMDTGKSFFATYLGNRLLTADRKVAVLDTDLGQSDIGPPGSQGILYQRKAVTFLSRETPSALYFVGSHSPGLHLMNTVVGTARLAWRGLRDNDTVIVNTTGWIQGDSARLLKTAKLDLLKPDMVVLLQRSDEAEHLIRSVDPDRVQRIQVSLKARDTDQFQRKSLREKASVKYFADAEEIVLPFARITTERCYFLSGTALEPLRDFPEIIWMERLSGYEGLLLVTKGDLRDEVAQVVSMKHSGPVRHFRLGEERGLLVGLTDEEGQCLGLGIIRQFNFHHRTITVTTPVRNSEAIRALQLGSVRCTPDGYEAGFVPFGRF